MSPFLMSINSLNPVAQRIQGASDPRFFSGSHRSLLLLTFLGLTVACAFAWLYIAEWRLQRGFRRYKLSEGALDEPFVQPVASPRPNLIATTRAKQAEPGATPAASAVAPENAAMNFANSFGPPVHGTSEAVWLSDVKGQTAPGMTPPTPAAAVTASGSSSVSATQVGVVHVVASHELAEIFIDGSFVGNPPAKLCLQAGSHTVQVRTPGRPDFNRQLTVTPGAELRLIATDKK